MPQQYPYGLVNDRYKKKLYVDTGMNYTEVKARIIEPYTSPQQQPRSKEIQIINAPSHFHGTGFSSYKLSLTLLFNDKQTYADYLAFSGWTHKFYDEKGSIYLGALESIKATPKVASTKYKVEITLLLVKKDKYDEKDRFEFTDIKGHWAETEIAEMANLGLVTVMATDGAMVLNFRPNAYITRAEFVAFLNRTRRFIEQVLRE